VSAAPVSRTQRVVTGVAASYLVTAASLAVRFLVTPLFLRYLGPELMGARYFLADILAYSALADLGIGQAVRSLVARDLRGDPSEPAFRATVQRLSAAAQVQYAISVLVFLAGVVVAVSVEHLVQGLSPQNVLMARVFAVASGLAIALTFWSTTYLAVLEGLQRMAQSSLFNLLALVISNGVGLALVLAGWSLYGVALAGLASAVVTLVQVRVRVRRLGVRLSPLRSPWAPGDARPVLKLGGWIMLGNLGGMLLASIARILAGVVPSLGLESVTLVALLLVLPLTLREQGARLAAIARPGLTELHYSGESRDRSRRAGFLLLRLCAVWAVLAFVLCWLLNGSFLALWVGAEYFVGPQANGLAAFVGAAGVVYMGLKVLTEVQFRFRRLALAQAAAGGTALFVGAALAGLGLGISGVLAGVVAGYAVVLLPWLLKPALGSLTDGPWLGAGIRVFAFPTGLLASWGLLGWFVPWRPTGWLGLFATGGFVAGATLVAGAAWLWRDFREQGWVDGIHSRVMRLRPGFRGHA
jgi:O-antigen/teichoic acid export membrane protein